MPTELLQPFAIGPNGSVAVTTNPDAAINQHVLNIVGTEPGERAVLTTYGVATQELLFSANDESVAQSIALQAQMALATYEPGVFLQSVTPLLTASGEGTAQVAVSYTRRDSATSSSSLSNNTNTAIVSVGGTVSEVIRG